MTVLSSRDNPRVRRWQALVRDARERRKEKRVLIEGEHLVEAFVDAGGKIEALILSKSRAAGFNLLAKRCGKTPIVLADKVFRAIADTDAPAGIAAEISLPSAEPDLKTAANCVFLEGVQDAGNVGAILRSAAAFGILHAALGQGCADAWSPKVLRAGMGAHFAMAILENADLAAAMESFGGKVACTVTRGGTPLADADLSGRIGWLFGAEGQGVSAALAARAQLKATVPMPGAAESLNVAAAAAICFYEFSRRAARA
ncbi:MAG TPA: RNA methyltransferase [Burkholderiales bacterium]|nr:RNA methyltransferase [Burkholderiales bacterium]